MILHSFPLLNNQYLAGSKMLQMPMLLVLADHIITLTLGLHFIPRKLEVYILTKLSITLDQVQWFIKPDTFFPFMARLDIPEKGK